MAWQRAVEHFLWRVVYGLSIAGILMVIAEVF